MARVRWRDGNVTEAVREGIRQHRLAYALLMPLMPDDAHGTLTGFYSLSRGIGKTA